MQYVGYWTFRGVVFLFWLIPFAVLYRLSNGVAWLLQNIFGYRKAVVFKQLRDSFPQKTEVEIAEIARLSYRNLADIMLESIKGFSLSDAQMLRRFRLTNPSVLHEDWTAAGNSISMAPHYGNWEWGIRALRLYLDERFVVGFYKPLSNVLIDKYARQRRDTTGLELIPIGETAQAFVRFADRPTAYVFVSDQSTHSDKAHWVTFLNQDTACPYGGDKYAHQFNFPVWYINVQRVRRGFYELTFEKLADNPAALPEQEVTKRFMGRLESIIVAQPENWLWSHKRWKKKRLGSV